MREEAFKREGERDIFLLLSIFESISNMRKKKRKIVQPLQMASRIIPVQLIHNGFYQVAKMFLR